MTSSASSSVPNYQRAQLTPETHVAYWDSWSYWDLETRQARAAAKSYSTIIAVHGVGYNSAIWLPLLPHLSPSTRLLAYNQRSYTGSSPAFEAREEGATDATAAYLGDLLGFFGFAVEELGVKGVDEEGAEEGGVTLLCWSKGSLLALSLLSLLHYSPPSPTNFLSHLPDSFSELPLSLLTTHLRSIILFEPPGSALGRPPTADYTLAMSGVDPLANSGQDFASAFAKWIGSSSLASSSITPPTLPPALVTAGWEPHCVAHGFSWRLSSLPSEVNTLAKQALAPPLSPAVGVGLIYGAQTNGYCFDAARTVGSWWGVGPGVDLSSDLEVVGGKKKKEEEEGEKELGEKEQQGEKVKVKTAIKRLEGAGVGSNHFAMVYQPERFVRAVEELWRELV